MQVPRLLNVKEGYKCHNWEAPSLLKIVTKYRQVETKNPMGLPENRDASSDFIFFGTT